ncbi:acyl carrier protein [Haematococcus lacustris]|uniref:Acyl carrier protein n=1 Tax=Haematococcus lacustris TaxID=44745 RepID=G9B655_HAELA|nr:acyl carrier protein [Haematococcus lacustris]
MALSLRSSLASTSRVQAPSRVRPALRVVITRATVDKEKVLSDVRAIISQQLGTDLDKVAADSKFVDLGADSLDTVEIMMALEEKFELTLDEEGAEKISTVQEAADMIATQISNK